MLFIAGVCRFFCTTVLIALYAGVALACSKLSKWSSSFFNFKWFFQTLNSSGLWSNLARGNLLGRHRWWLWEFMYLASWDVNASKYLMHVLYIMICECRLQSSTYLSRKRDPISFIFQQQKEKKSSGSILLLLTMSMSITNNLLGRIVGVNKLNQTMIKYGIVLCYSYKEDHFAHTSMMFQKVARI